MDCKRKENCKKTGHHMRTNSNMSGPRRTATSDCLGMDTPSDHMMDPVAGIYYIHWYLEKVLEVTARTGVYNRLVLLSPPFLGV